MSVAYVLKRPIITERSLAVTKEGKFTFEVDRLASKGQIKEAVESQFGVTVLSVNTMKLAGKRRRTGRRKREITYPDGKKSVVQLKKGQKIDLFEVES